MISTTQLHHHIQDPDGMRIYQASREAGLSSFGIIAVDVWLIGDDGATGSSGSRGQIIHSGVLWTSPQFCQQNPSEALDRVVDPEHPDYVKPSPQVAGAGLAGYFVSLGKSIDANGGLIWRNLTDITSDPFQPPYERMLVLEEAGFGKVTGLHFDVPGGHQGIVLYFARGTADERMLNEPSNVHFLCMATQHIGTACAMSRLRQLSIRAKSSRTQRIWQRVKTKIFCYRAFLSLSVGSLKRHRSYQRMVRGFSFSSWERTPSDPSLLRMSIRVGFVKPLIAFNDRAHLGILWLFDEARYRILSVLEKSKGSTIRPPPAVPLLNAIWTFWGVYVTLLMLVAVKTLFVRYWSSSLILAPFGALLTLQYSLTAAPASQPRNVLYGLCICLGITLLCQYVLLHQFMCKKELVLPLAGALGISIMTKLGVVHPPAAAAMMALLDGYDPESTHFITTIKSATILLGANLLAIGTSIVINNLSEKRQYPVYWAMGAGFPKKLSRMLRRLDDCSPGGTLPLIQHSNDAISSS